MVFSSIIFLLYFLPLFLVAYFLTPVKFRNWTLLTFSVLFYAWGAPEFVFILIASTVLDFYLVRWMHRSSTRKRKRFLLTLSILLNIGLLAYFKYANFFIENILEIFLLFGWQRMEWAEVMLPIGISFYTFQTLTYSVDVYRGKSQPLDSLHNYTLYIMMFPQLIAGPIVRYNTIAKELINRSAPIESRLIGFYRFSIGLAKKVILANPLGAFVDQNLSGPIESMGMTQSWLVITAYAFQIFFDFSGYSDMAIGLGRMMGFTFPENFNRPYKSKSITEFWRRWHITLSEWMRDYLYIPLGGSKVNTKSRLYFNLVLVFLLSGLWHGAAWNFVLWGAFHGAFLILDRVFLKSLLNKLPGILALAITFFITLNGWVIFRIEQSNLAMEFYGKMYSFSGFDVALADQRQLVLTLLFGGVIAFIPKYNWSIRSLSVKRHLLAFAYSIILFIISVSMITSSNFNPFIYFRF